MKILITGGMGFIGKHLARLLLEEGHEITILDNLNNGQKAENLSRIKFVKGDVRDAKLIEDVSNDKDIICHLAALANIRKSIENPDYCFTTNVVGTFNVLEAAKKNNVKKVIFSSSREVYGNAPAFPVKESCRIMPYNLYGATKACSEHLCNVYRQEHGLNITIFRLANVYGAGDEVEGRVIPTFIKNINNNEIIAINGGEQILDFVWIDDVTRILAEAIKEYDNETINIGSGRGTTILELAELMKDISGRDVKIAIKPPIKQEVKKFIADISRIGISPFPLEKGLRILLNNALEGNNGKSI